MKEIIIDSLIDSFKLIPFLFIAFLIIEFIEHKLTDRSKKLITKTGKFGPFLGGLLGAVPQCGFSVMATNLYVTRIITLGTLVAVYLSTSDEMLPILLAQSAPLSLIIKIILTKVLIGIGFGIIIDFVIRKNINNKAEVFDICEHDHCHCERENLIISTLKHTFNIFIFILLMNFILNFLFSYVGEDMVSKLILKNSIFEPFITCLIGLIPNCGSSVMLTELYLNNVITYSSLISGLLTGSGVAILVLFKTNNNLKENMFILGSIYFIGVFIGILFRVLGVM